METSRLKYDTSFWLEFLQLYKSKPALWKVDSDIYKDKKIKSKSMLEMVAKMKEIYPEAEVDTVKRKIESFRSIYRRELKRMRTRRKSGLPYKKPTWIYFDCFTFLKEQKDPLYEDYFQHAAEMEESNGKADEEGDDEEHDYHEIEVNALKCSQNYISMKIEKAETDDEEWDCQEIELQARSATPASSASKPKHFSQRKRQHSSSPNSYSRYEFVAASPEPSSNVTQDEADILGLSVTMQYRKLSKEQKIYAKKAIDDILFEAKLETLHRHSIKINEIYDNLCVGCSAQIE